LDGQVILFVGSLSDRKNAITLVRAFAALPAKVRKETHLLIVGPTGCDHKTIQEIILSEAIGEQVHLVGYVNPSCLPAYFGVASMFAFPSLSESFGFPPLEAMAAGLPVLCSNAPNLPETVGKAAILIPPLDVDEWTKAMQRVLTDHTLQAELRERGKAHVRQFDWSVCATTMTQILRAAAADNG
jgi:glycosyltransferase involved in cell wall biosynthesis